jgi:effector-binding domain-containing protein
MKIELSEEKSLLALAVKRRANMNNLVTLVDEGYALLWEYISNLGKEVAGPPYIAYFGMGEEFDIELGFPVAEEIPGTEDIYMSKTQGGKSVVGMHFGSYQGLEQAYGEIFKYMEEQKLEPAGIFYDFYLNDPSITPAEELITKIVIPVK